MKPADATALFVLSLIWGSAFLLNDVVVEEMPPVVTVAGRLIIAAVMLTTMALVSGRGWPPRAMWPVLLALAVVNNVMPFTLITWAQQYITSSLAATLNATMPLFTFVLAVGIGSERGDLQRAAGVVVGFAGTAILIGPDITDLTNSNTLGELAVIAGALCYAVGTIIARQKLRGDPIVLASGQMIFAAAVAIPLTLAVDGVPNTDVSLKAAMALLALGVFSSGVAYIIFFTLIQRVSATNVALVSYMIPVVATLLGWLILDEKIGLNLFVGLTLIIAGMVAVNGGAGALFRRGRGDASVVPPPT